MNPPHRQSTIIGSPRSRRSVQQTTSPTYQAPAVPGEQYVPPPTAALHAPDGDAFNIDPTTPYLDSAPASAQQNTSPPTSGLARSNSKRFVGGFVAVVKKAMRQQGGQTPQNSEEGRPFAADRNPEPSYRSPPPPAAPVSHTGLVHAEPTPAANDSPVTPSSPTRHGSVDSGSHDDGTTAVEHEMLPVARVIESPVYIEPQLGSDYAKMDSPRRSITSLASYMSRVRQFFHELNELPWIAERVTVDYVPGESKGRRQARERRAQRPTSWYGDLPHHTVDLFSASTSPTSLPTTHPAYSTEPEVIFRMQSPDAPTQNLPYVSVVPASFSLTRSAPPPSRPVVQQPQPPPTPAPQTQRMRQPPPASTPAQSPPIPAFRPYGETYPMGYVPYRQQAAVAEQYNDLSIHNMSQVPARAVSSASGTATATHPSRPASTQATQPSRPASAAAAATPLPSRPASMQYPYPVMTPA